MKRNKTALAAAVDLLAARAYSVKMLTDKLMRKGYAEEEIQAAVEKLLLRGYLNDEGLCRELYRRYIAMEKYSLKQIEYKLQQKGFDRDTINFGGEKGDEQAERTAALKLLKSKYSSRSEADEFKMIQFLYAKGFGRSSIAASIAAFTEGDCRESLAEDVW